jgi:hypothetical protein
MIKEIVKQKLKIQHNVIISITEMYYRDIIQLLISNNIHYINLDAEHDLLNYYNPCANSLWNSITIYRDSISNIIKFMFSITEDEDISTIDYTDVELLRSLKLAKLKWI